MSGLYIIDIAVITDDHQLSNKFIQSIFDFNENNIIRTGVNSKIIWIGHNSVQVNAYQYNLDTVKNIPNNKFFHLIVFINKISSGIFDKNFYDKSYKVFIIDEKNIDNITPPNFFIKRCQINDDDSFILLSKTIIKETFDICYGQSHDHCNNEFDIFNGSVDLQRSLLGSKIVKKKYHTQSCCVIS